MGTRRSRHNKGRKPLYKDFERETVRHWDVKEKHLVPKVIHPPIRRSIKPSGTPVLVAAVARYLEKRNRDEARKELANVFPTKAKPEFKIIDGEVLNSHLYAENPDLIQASNRDILLQLFVERNISASQLHAGRKWQMYREAATIQPNMSLVWHQAVNRMPYQQRGDLSDAQLNAMAHRRNFLTYVGAASVAFLDFCLDADRGRAELLEVLKIEASALTAVFNDLLSKLCACFSAEQERLWKRTI